MDELERQALEADFETRMYETYRDAAKVKYFAGYFHGMLQDRGGLATAQHCLGSQTDGFTTLWELGKLELSVEFVALQPRWAPLFTKDERATARQRLLDAKMPDLVARAEAMP